MKMKVEFHSLEKFKMWEYRVSHQSLLIRNIKSAGGNTDMIFMGVEYLNIPVLLNGVEVFLCEDGDVVKNKVDFFSSGESSKIYFVRSGGGEGFVISFSLVFFYNCFVF
jgi:hypothetical protein